MAYKPVRYLKDVVLPEPDSPIKISGSMDPSLISKEREGLCSVCNPAINSCIVCLFFVHASPSGKTAPSRVSSFVSSKII